MEPQLTGKRILIVEDEYLIAADIQRDLQTLKADVLGPVSQTSDALAILEREPVDAAVLDINLGRERSYSVADRLTRENIPYLFVTGYDGAALPADYRGEPRLTKPIDAGQLAQAIHGLFQRSPAG